jgi:hypothetical protein
MMSGVLLDMIQLSARQRQEREELKHRQAREYGLMLGRLREMLMVRPSEVVQGDALIYRDDLYQVVSVEKNQVTLFDVYREELKFSDVHELKKHGKKIIEFDDSEDDDE